MPKPEDVVGTEEWKRKRKDAPESFVDADDGELPEDVEQALIELLDDTNKVQVYRRREGGQPSYVDEVRADDFSVRDIKRIYGGGDYLFRFVNAAGKWIAHKKFNIEGEPRDPEAERRQAEMREQLERERGGQPAAEAGALIEMMRLYLDDMRSRSNAAGEANPLEMMLNMNRLIMENTAQMMQALTKGGGKGDGTSLSDLLEVLQLGMELKDTYGGGGDGGVLGPLAQEVIATLREGRGKGKAALMDRNRGQSPAAEPPSQPAPPPQPGGDAGWLQVAQRFVPMLVARAQAGSSSELYAEVLDDALAEYPSARMELYERAKADPEALITMVGAGYPAARPHAPWFRDLLATFVQLIEGGDDDDAEDAQPVPGRDVSGSDSVGDEQPEREAGSAGPGAGD